MKRFNDVNEITKKDLYAIFVNAVMNSSDDTLDAFTKSEVFEESEAIDEDGNVVVEENEVGKLKLIYANTDKGYLTYIVTFVNEEYMTVYNMEKGITVAKFNKNKETGGWSNIESAELDGVEVARISEVLTKVVSRLKKQCK